MKKKCLVFVLPLIFLLGSNYSGYSQMTPLGDKDLEQITALAGISIGVVNVRFFAYQPYISYTDTDSGNSLQLCNMTINNGQGGLLEFSVGKNDVGGDGLVSPLEIDVFQNPDGYLMTGFQALDWEQELGLDVQEVFFCDQALGGLHAGPIEVPSWQLFLAPHNGLDLEYDLSFHLQEFAYEYRVDDPGTTEDESQSLIMSNLYLVQTFTQNSADDPADSGTWEPQGMFQLGDLNVQGTSSYSPATIDVGVDPATNLAQVVMSLPCQGSLRIANLSVGGTSFGPIAIDNIQIHRLTIRYLP